MTMIKCDECGKDISSKASACVGCGAPIGAKRSIGDLDGDGKLGLGDVKAAVGLIRNKAVETAQGVAKQGKKALRSRQERDTDALEELKQGFKDPQSAAQTDSQKRCTKFTGALNSTIDVKFAEIMRGKKESEKYLTYVDGQILTASVRNIFKKALGSVPPQVEAACNLSDAILAPTAAETQKMIKAAAGVGGGAAGIAMIIGAVAAALGWGVGVSASVAAFFVGTSGAGPIGWAVAGVTLAGVAAYFATSSDEHVNTERFLRVLKSAAGSATEAIWAESDDALSRALSSEPAA